VPSGSAGVNPTSGNLITPIVGAGFFAGDNPIWVANPALPITITKQRNKETDMSHNLFLITIFTNMM
jgi:hypothetical protein